LWCNWLVWAFGGKLVDKDNRVVIDSPETIKALEYAKEMYATFIPGTLSWLDPNNNKAFLDGQISVTNNGISIYYATKNSTDPKVRELKEDVYHANYPVGPVGVPTESHLFFNQMIMKYTKYPQAAKEFLRFMMEKEQFEPCRGLHRAALGGLRKGFHLVIRSQAPRVPGWCQELASRRLRRQAGLRLSGCRC
jgi:multiple sugar transport system substrate-binding protein